MPGENPRAKGVKHLLKAYKTAKKIRDAKVTEGKQPKPLNILVKAMQNKIAQKQNEIDNPVMELPMPAFWSFKTPSEIPLDNDKMNDLEGGEIELQPA
jgi:hypothetical protein